jgi:DNA-binding transcriptional ArsR family regulator
MNYKPAPTQLADLFKAISQPARIQILLAIGTGEACVCHLEARLDLRQAYLSQHLMALRQVGILKTRRDGRFIYYRLFNLQMLDLVNLAAKTLGLPAERLVIPPLEMATQSCGCPQCSPAEPENLIQVSLPTAE